MAHIGIDARLTYYRVGGISTYIRRLVHALEILATDNTYTVFHSRKDRHSLVSRFAHDTLWTPAHHRIERLALSVELLPRRLDLFHSPDFIPPYRAAKRHIITVHDLTFIHYPQHIAAEGRRYYNHQIKEAVHHADHILVVSEATRQDLIDILNVAAEKITVQPNGVDERFTPQSTETIRETRKFLNLPDEYILFVGTIEPRKNIDGLLTAYENLHLEMRDAPPLVLVGRHGWLIEDTINRIETMQQKGLVQWCDNVSDSQLPAVYSGALALVMPSFYEGFGLPALEAMACGTVPIVSDRPSLPEIVGDVGITVDPYHPDTITNALLHTITNSAWRKQMEIAGIERAKMFTWERSAQIALDAYNAIL